MAFVKHEDGSILVGMLPEEKPVEVKEEAAVEEKPKKRTTKKSK